MATVATKPDEQSRRKNERELWLILIGAMLASQKFKTDVLTELTAGDCPFDDLAGFLGALQRDDQETAWGWAQRFGALKDDKTTIIKATMVSLKESTVRRLCRNAAQLVSASGTIENPAQFVEMLKDQIRRVEAKL